jgi:hypothetical protein
MIKIPEIYFVGAGVSCNSPSDFPVAREIIDLLLKAISPDKLTFQTLQTLSNPRHINKQTAGGYIRFESLLDVISEIDPSLELLDFIDLFKNPNELHRHLATKAIQGPF